MKRGQERERGSVERFRGSDVTRGQTEGPLDLRWAFGPWYTPKKRRERGITGPGGPLQTPGPRRRWPALYCRYNNLVRPNRPVAVAPAHRCLFGGCSSKAAPELRLNMPPRSEHAQSVPPLSRAQIGLKRPAGGAPTCRWWPNYCLLETAAAEPRTRPGRKTCDKKLGAAAHKEARCRPLNHDIPGGEGQLIMGSQAESTRTVYAQAWKEFLRLEAQNRGCAGLDGRRRTEDMSIIAERFNDQGAQLACYQNRIVGAHDEYGGGAWKDYDREFRRIKVNKPDLGWDQIDVIAWLWFTNQPHGNELQPFRASSGAARGPPGGSSCQKRGLLRFQQAHVHPFCGNLPL
ncbi:hypothetical protein NDU88_003152 [Pleurodeles waltl]|uniref:Uncharacterized protein n=1 Tax=Pleurodeles waltl TaxID=8319 RepID=A0AAV7UBQ4_PLEWA|nr:hypothetical protein NDU88_003152 [Pleurodeles waltl]